MSTMGLKEKAVLASLGMFLLYGLAVVIWFLKMDITSRQGDWNRAQRRYREACANYRSECRLISEKRDWIDAYDREKASMPTFRRDLATDTTWLEKVGEVAKKHKIDISSRKAGKEIAADDVLEQKIDCNWEGSLESLVKFMHELENSEGGMFDFHSISFKPSSKKGYLKGSFTVTCAYMRE